MFRAYILLGFTILIAQLHISGNITKYINMKYAYLSKTAAIILGFLTVVQIIIVFPFTSVIVITPLMMYP